jgi:hypothetical protein
VTTLPALTVIKDELDHPEENMLNFYRFSCQESQIRIRHFWIRIPLGLKILDPATDPQHILFLSPLFVGALAGAVPDPDPKQWYELWPTNVKVFEL